MQRCNDNRLFYTQVFFLQVGLVNLRSLKLGAYHQTVCAFFMSIPKKTTCGNNAWKKPKALFNLNS